MKKGDFKKHKGEYLDSVVRKTGITIKALTASAGFDRTTYYHHITDPHLPYKVISRYGEVLKFDFSPEYPEIQRARSDDPQEITTFEEMKKDRDYWRSRFFDLAEKLAENYKKENT
ncbi:hypothetical protein HDF26_002481 [Pedobacter cryoconitis]|uniref:Uncharacterized protein n=1 Tax=Pedobacter cryoconitis TaxID=188932 RepID=A0A7W8ZJA6_9SPHI|nr:hypothetical protein [Pedobacter cryoconitis]MBB5634843.1 hypothetical protein [Pedobacter cryoconitis]MBB6272024.1 hypothetical protein [Pedobacter cryoconitis]